MVDVIEVATVFRDGFLLVFAITQPTAGVALARRERDRLQTAQKHGADITRPCRNPELRKGRCGITRRWAGGDLDLHPPTDFHPIVTRNCDLRWIHPCRALDRLRSDAVHPQTPAPESLLPPLEAIPRRVRRTSNANSTPEHRPGAEMTRPERWHPPKFRTMPRTVGTAPFPDRGNENSTVLRSLRRRA